jgi:transcriptional regulator with XRE-family HTH domain
MSEFGARLQSLRTKRGLTVKEVCQLVGIPQSRLSELERGVRIPTSGQIERLEKFYETRTGELAALAQSPGQIESHIQQPDNAARP